MGQARLRGSFEERKAQAIAEGRSKPEVKKQRLRTKVKDLFHIPNFSGFGAGDFLTIAAALTAHNIHRKKYRNK